MIGQTLYVSRSKVDGYGYPLIGSVTINGPVLNLRDVGEGVAAEQDLPNPSGCFLVYVMSCDDATGGQCLYLNAVVVRIGNSLNSIGKGLYSSPIRQVHCPARRGPTCRILVDFSPNEAAIARIIAQCCI